MKKISLVAALILGASLAYGDVIYWMVGSDYAEAAKQRGEENAATLYYVYDGNATALDYLTGSDVADRFYTDEILEKLGIKPVLFSEDNITPEIQYIVYSSAYNHIPNIMNRPVLDDTSQYTYFFSYVLVAIVLGDHSNC